MKFSRLLSATALAGSLLVVAPAFGQSAPPADAPQTDPAPVEADGSESAGGEVLVTGSRIPRPQYEGVIPGAQVTAEQIETRSFGSVLEALNDQPLVGPGASPFGTNGGQPASLGASFVDLLDLGTQRTLTLVNGRRFVSGNAASLFVASNATGAQVDLNSIPSLLTERIDVLTVGGAAAYGSDAIAGVVNVILRNDFEGIRFSGRAGITEQGDGGNYQLSSAFGTNFADGRGNISVTLEGTRDEALFSDSREGFARTFIAPTSFRNGGQRNGTFAPSYSLTANNGAFLPAGSDLVPNNIAGSGFSGGSILVSNAGAIFQANANITNFQPAGFQGIATTDPQSATLSPGFRPQVLINQAGNTNLVPGTPIAVAQAQCNTTTFGCLFAPTSLPTTSTAFVNGVIARYAPALAADTAATAAQRSALALQLLQANSLTPREYLARNPNTPINAFIGTLIPNFLDVANTDAASAGALPRTAVPLQFSANGTLVAINSGVIADPAVTPGTTGGAVTPDFYNTAAFTPLRIQQKRFIGNLIGHFDLTPGITVYTENLYARVNSLSPRNLASSNPITAATAENAALVLNINNPYLTAANRATLTAAGVTGPFVLSRSNQDIVGDNPASVFTETYRSVVGLRGKFEMLGRQFGYDASFTYGRAEASGSSLQIKDIEYALAVNAVQTNNGIVCGAQITPGSVGATPAGVVGLEVVREMGADGIITERTIRRVATAEQVAACKPLNLFGFNQMSAESKDYVLARTGFSNLSQQYFAQAILNGSLFDLPAGPLGFALNGDYRRESLDYRTDNLSRTGATRTAALAATSGYIEAVELSAEARIPVLGEGFNLPLLRNLEFSPAIRVVRQSGDAPDVRLLSGTVINNKAAGKWNQIYTLAGNWRPISDLMFRGNFTRSIRQPSITELFLGGQPAFSAVTDPCAPANISLGLLPATRRANCERAVIAAGLATDQAGAATFLNNYVPSGASINGNFTGSPGLLPERGRSWTVGGVLTPRFLPGLTASVDYINVEVRDQIIPTTIATALQVCYDSPSFPDTASEVGVNVCSFFNRIPSTGTERRFEIDNGFNSGFINLGGLRVKAVNAVFDYVMPLNEWIGENWGKFSLGGSAYHLISYGNSPSGRFNDTQESAGSVSAGRPEWEVQLRGRYEVGQAYAQWTWNWQDKTRLFSGGLPVAGTDTQNESQDLLNYPAYGIHNVTVGMDINKARNFRLQLTVNNVFDKQYIGPFAQSFALPNANGRVDDFGRRFVVTAVAKY